MTLEVREEAAKRLRGKTEPSRGDLELARLLDQVSYELQMSVIESDVIPTWLHAEINNVAKSINKEEIPKESPSQYQHAVFPWDETIPTSYDGSRKVKVTTPVPLTAPNAALISSELLDPVSQKVNGRHAVAVDIDLPAKLVPSSTPDHYHLYIDKEMSWKQYKKLLRAMVKAGIVEKGYYKASVRYKASYLRLPWVKKSEVKLSSSY